MEPLRLTTPCLFPNGDGDAQEARIISDQFYPLKLDLQKAAFGRPLYVKRRTQGLVSKGPLRMQQSLLVQSGTFKGGDFVDLVKSLTRNTYMRAFAKYILCAYSASTKSQHGLSVEEFCKAVLLECLSGCTDLTLPIYLRMRTALSLIEGKSSSASLLAWDFRLIRSFYEASTMTSPSLLNIERVAYLIESAERNGSLVRSSRSRK
jgi:Anaphase-promoting complex sub unit 1 C-terminal domain